MLLEWNETDSGRTSISLSVSREAEVLAFPRELLFDLRLDSLPPDRLWVAAALCFGSRAPGVWEGEFPISPSVMTAVQTYLRDDVVISARVTEDAHQWYPGNAAMLVDAEYARSNEILSTSVGADLTLEIRRLGDWVGRLFSIDRVIMAANAFAFSADPSGFAGNSTVLALGVLVATDLQVDRIVLPTSRMDTVKWEARAADLCGTVGVEVLFEDPFKSASR